MLGQGSDQTISSGRGFALEPKCLGSNPSSVTSGRLLNLSVPPVYLSVG